MGLRGRSRADLALRVHGDVGVCWLLNALVCAAFLGGMVVDRHAVLCVRDRGGKITTRGQHAHAKNISE
jgi:hypothetical protein